MNKYTLIAIFLVAGAAIGGWIGIKYQRDKDLAGVSFCKAGDLVAKMEFQGAAGNIYGTFTITNNSSKNCRINGRNYIEVVYPTAGNGNLGFIQAGLPSVESYTLLPGRSVYAVYHAPNGPQCSTGIHQVPATFRYGINGETITFSDLRTGSQQTSVVNCNLQTDMTQITISNLSDTQPNQ